MPKNRWERPKTQKGDSRRAAQKRRSASAKEKKGSLRLLIDLISGRKR
jgi:hypothetical protein